MTSLINFRPLSTLSDMLDSVLEYPRSSARECSTSWPLIDIVEQDNEYVLSADVPGVAKENISVEVDKGILIIKGKRPAAHLSEKSWAHRERLSGEFSRSFRLSDNVNPEGIVASYDNGVLVLTIKKSEPALAKKIQIS